MSEYFRFPRNSEGWPTMEVEDAQDMARFAPPPPKKKAPNYLPEGDYKELKGGFATAIRLLTEENNDVAIVGAGAVEGEEEVLVVVVVGKRKAREVKRVVEKLMDKWDARMEPKA